jgi:hypothetical protein
LKGVLRYVRNFYIILDLSRRRPVAKAPMDCVFFFGSGNAVWASLDSREEWYIEVSPWRGMTRTFYLTITTTPYIMPTQSLPRRGRS